MVRKLDKAVVLLMTVFCFLYGVLVVWDTAEASADFTDYARVHDVSQPAYVEANIRTLGLIVCAFALCIVRLLRPQSWWLLGAFYAALLGRVDITGGGALWRRKARN